MNNKTIIPDTNLYTELYNYIQKAYDARPSTTKNYIYGGNKNEKFK